MKSHSAVYRMLIAIASISFLLTALVFIRLTKNVVSPDEGNFLPVLLSALAYLIIVNLVSGKNASAFNTDFPSLQGKQDEYRKQLDHFGRVPLKTLLVFILISAVWSSTLRFSCATLGMRTDVLVPLIMLLTSVSMLAASFIYVIGDNNISITLLSGKLREYPVNLKYPRQRNKNFIIPFFIAIMTVFCAVAIQQLQINLRGYMSLENAGKGNGMLYAFFTAYLLIVGTLVFLWTKGNSLIYKSLMKQLEDLTASEKNLAGRINVASIDELGFIAGRVNEFCQGLSVSVVELKEAQKALTDLGSELHSSAKDSAEAIARISESVEEVSGRMRDQAGSVQESSGAVEQIARNIESLEDLINEQASSVTEASASIEEMVGNINSITASTNKMAARFSELLSASEAGKEAQASSDIRIKQIAERSKALFDANQVIAGIAAQTNLLAMNAAIEAAHAGDAGRGFSVVADEIRSLAETSAKQSKNIRQEISSVQKAIEELVTASKGSEASYGKVVNLITETGGLAKELEQAMAEQRNGSMEILEALRAMNSITQQVQSGSKEMTSGNETVLGEIGRLKENTQAIGRSMSAMKDASENINRSSRRFNELADGTADTILRMDEALKGFRT